MGETGAQVQFWPSHQCIALGDRERGPELNKGAQDLLSYYVLNILLCFRCCPTFLGLETFDDSKESLGTDEGVLSDEYSVCCTSTFS